MWLSFSSKEIISCFMVLFAIIDITGAIPIIIDLKKSSEIKGSRVALYSFCVLLLFLFAGDALLGLFGVDISSFAVAGAIIIFILAVEMILGVELFKMDGPSGTSSIVPLIFPLIAGAGTLTALLSLRAEYQLVNIITALFLNMVIVFIVIRYAGVVERIIGKGGVYILRKFFGIILLAIAVKLFTTNIVSLIS